jgi:hypothetical protein
VVESHDSVAVASTSSTTRTVATTDNDKSIDEIGSFPFEILLVDGIGRAVVASEPQTDIGKVLFREKPIIVWDTEGGEVNTWRSYLDAFKDLESHDKALILDMHSPNEECQIVRNLDRIARTLCDEYERELGHELTLKLLATAETNAHEYYGRPAGDFQETCSVDAMIARRTSGRAALFVYGSKVAHSCHPNISYTSKTEDGRLEYKVIAPIEAGGILKFSYIDTGPANPTHI